MLAATHGHLAERGTAINSAFWPHGFLLIYLMRAVPAEVSLWTPVLQLSQCCGSWMSLLLPLSCAQNYIPEDDYGWHRFLDTRAAANNRWSQRLGGRLRCRWRGGVCLFQHNFLLRAAGKEVSVICSARPNSWFATKQERVPSLTGLFLSTSILFGLVL